MLKKERSLKAQDVRPPYEKHIERNIGFITWEEQEFLRTSKIAVLGVGGLGGPLVEQLVRAGSENLLIADHDTFEVSNLNRQLCDQDDLGRSKVNVLEQKMKFINPQVNIMKISHINQANIEKVLEEVSVIALTLDDPIISILIARICRKKGIPMLETWAIPYLCAWWFTSESPSYEECYELNTEHMEMDEILNSEDIKMDVNKTLIPKVLKFPGLKDRLNREPGTLDKMMSGQIGLRSFAPIVRMSASYLAFELIFSGLLQIKPKILAPNVIGYDYFTMNPLSFSLNGILEDI